MSFNFTKWVLSFCYTPIHISTAISTVKAKPCKRVDDFPVDLLPLIGEFIDNPRTYFRLKRSCKRFHRALPPTFVIAGTNMMALYTSGEIPPAKTDVPINVIITPPLCSELVGLLQACPTLLLPAMEQVYSHHSFTGLFQPPVVATEYFLAATASHAHDFNFLKKLAMIATSGHDVRMYHVFLNLARDSNRATLNAAIGS